MITYARMRHDPQIKAILNAYGLPLQRATWAVDPAGCRDEVVQQVADDLGLSILGADEDPGPARRRGVVWQRHLRTALQSLVFGHMPFERRYRFDGQRLRLDNLGERMPWTIAYIELDPKTQTIANVLQTTQNEPIPGPPRIVWYAHEPEGANWAGISMLRPLYGAWLLKHETWRVHATGIRRFSMGVPNVEAPPGASQGQVQQARDLASGMRVGDQSGAGMPAGFKFNLTGITGSVPNALDFIKYLDQAMVKMGLAQMIELGQTHTGSRALGETFFDLFKMAIQSVAEEIATVATSGQEGLSGIVTDLVDVNWGEDEPAPKIVCPDAGENRDDIYLAISSLVTAGALDPDDNLDAWLRTQLKLPERAEPEPEPTPPPALPGPPPDGAVPQRNEPPPGPTGPAVAQPIVAANATKPPGLHRQPTKLETAAGHDALAVHADWKSAVDGLLTAYKAQVLPAQKVQLVDQVEAAVNAGKTGQLAQLTADAGPGAELVKQAMVTMAGVAARRMAAEAAAQGVTIDLGKVVISADRLGVVAGARAELAASYLAQQASSRALQVAASLPAGTPGDRVALLLDQMSDTSLRDQLGAALTAAQNAGRVAVLEAAPQSAGTAQYVATEIEDNNTCQPCYDIDQTVFDSLAAAEDAYPVGGYIDCLGGPRCRGTVMALWGGTPGNA